MQKRRLLSWLTLLSVAVIVLAGCAPRAGGGLAASQAGDKPLVIDLPALVVDFGADGKPSVGNIPLTQLAASMPAAADSVSKLVIPADTVKMLTQSNIQNVQVDNGPNGLIILVNGEPIPSIRWDGNILSNTGDLIAKLGAGTPALEKLLPVLANIGLGVILRFPVKDGEAAIPTYVENGQAATTAKKAQTDFLASVGNTPPTITLPIFYKEDGTWRVGDLSDTEWSNLTNLPLQATRLTPGGIKALMNAGITQISLFTNKDGLHISINDHDLPYIGWGDGELNHLIDLGNQMGLLNAVADPSMNMGEVIGLVQSLLPAVEASNANINVYLPGSLAAASQ